MGNCVFRPPGGAMRESEIRFWPVLLNCTTRKLVVIVRFSSFVHPCSMWTRQTRCIKNRDCLHGTYVNKRPSGLTSSSGLRSHPLQKVFAAAAPSSRTLRNRRLNIYTPCVRLPSKPRVFMTSVGVDVLMRLQGPALLHWTTVSRLAPTVDRVLTLAAPSLVQNILVLFVETLKRVVSSVRLASSQVGLFQIILLRINWTNPRVVSKPLQLLVLAARLRLLLTKNRVSVELASWLHFLDCQELRMLEVACGSVCVGYICWRSCWRWANTELYI